VQDPNLDEQVADGVRSRLEQHEMIDASRVSIQVVNGEVTMIGTADNRFIRHRAEELASEVEGVQKIVNKISVQPPMEEPGPILSTHEPGAKGGSTQRS
jgi:osmotically-inducible protein OsmY